MIITAGKSTLCKSHCMLEAAFESCLLKLWCEPHAAICRSGKDFEDPLEKSKQESSVSGSSEKALPKADHLVGAEVEDEKGQETDHFEEGKKTGVHQS